MSLTLLRTRTAALHKSVEAQVNLEQSLANLNEYEQLLQKSYGYHFAIEDLYHREEWQRFPELEMPKRSRLAYLERDLLNLGLAPELLLSSPIPQKEELPTLTTFPQAWGAAYVLEGSTLGGAWIHKRIRESYGDDWADKLSFHAGHKQNTGMMWKQFCHNIEDYSQSLNASGLEEMIQAAEKTFQTYGNWLARN